MFTDISFSCISAIELYETSCWSRSCTGQPCAFHGVRNSSHHPKHVLIILNRYNGTPRGLPNCNQGGCRHCNSSTSYLSIPCECVCLHAEENALLEAGRERVGQNAVLYCDTLVILWVTVLFNDSIWQLSMSKVLHKNNPNRCQDCCIQFGLQDVSDYAIMFWSLHTYPI
jgi:hypothetical protein